MYAYGLGLIDFPFKFVLLFFCEKIGLREEDRFGVFTLAIGPQKHLRTAVDQVAPICWLRELLLNYPKNQTRGRMQHDEEVQSPTSKPNTTGGRGGPSPPSGE